MNKKTIYMLSVLLCFLFSCKTEKCVKNNAFKTKVEVVGECSFDDRKAVEIIIGLEGKIIRKTQSIYLIGTQNGTKYYPCNLPESLKKEGVKVFFCGKKKKEKPTEKVIANLLKITSLYTR